MNKDKTEQWRIFLWQFTDVAIRYIIDKIHESVSKKYPYSPHFQIYFIENGSLFFDEFKNEFRNNYRSMNDTEKLNFHNELKRDFKFIEIYLDWFKDNKSKTLKFNPYNPYEILFNLCTLTNAEFELLKEKQAKDTKHNPHPRIFIDETAFELFEYLKTMIIDELADYSYYYHRLKQDSLIYEGVKNVEFSQWLTDTYGIELTQKIQPFKKNIKKHNTYITAKQLHKI